MYPLWREKMKQIRWIDWVILFLVGFVLFLAASGAAVASWDEPQVKLTPGTWQVVEFTNDGDKPENLTVTNISAPDVLLSYVVVSPVSIPPSSAENVVIQFAYVPTSVRESIPQDVFSVQIDGLIVYLDLSVPLPENAENRWATIEARIDALGTSLADQIAGLAVRITALESIPKQENWMPEAKALWENLIRLGDWTTSKIMELWANIPENSPPTNLAWVVALLDNQEARIRAAIGNDIANLEIERRLAETRDENERLRYVAYAAIAIAIIAAVIAIRRPKLNVPSLKQHQRKFDEIPLGDKIAMLENEISAMKERDDPEDAIKEKESELWELRRQLKPKKPRKGGK